ncbi:MAG: hypothetical protein GF344_19450 [Chitinivibrionales bacterium]|nr:hypothetical protein [Chitinivibrionales bacterium]MBD3358802.1 hypothetical protein [Chitinivibrionales bacterium]
MLTNISIRLIGAAVVLMFHVMGIGAQVVVEEEVITDTVDVFSPVEQTGKSPALAMVATVLVPGLGHQYLGKSHRALTYFSLEALCVFGLVYGRTYADKYGRDARSYAWAHANVKAQSGADDHFWRNVGHFMDSEEYNRIMELNRTPDDKYLETELWWRWADEADMEHYQTLRETSTRWELVGTSFVAGMVLNRIISFIDVRLTSKYRGVRSSARLKAYPHYSALTNAAGLQIRGSF